MKNICLLKLFTCLVIFRVNRSCLPWNQMKLRRHVVFFSRWGSQTCIPGNWGLSVRALGVEDSRAPHHHPNTHTGGARVSLPGPLRRCSPLTAWLPTWVQKEAPSPAGSRL